MENQWLVVSNSIRIISMNWWFEIGFDVYGFDQNAKEDQEGNEKASKLCKISYW